jgi:hypothetical protein
MRQSREQIELLQLVRSRLPDPLCDHCCAASINDKELRLQVDSPAWAGRLRFMQGVLKQALQQVGIPISTLKVGTTPGDQSPIRRHRPPLAPLTQDNAGLIQQSAADVADPALRDALSRLAGHLAPTTNGKKPAPR